MTMPRPLPDELAELIAERFRLLSEPMRIRILDRLREGPRSVGALAEDLATSQQNVSKHLGLLHRAGVLARDKEGTSTIYRIADATVFDMCEHVCGGIQRRLTELRSLMGEEVAG
ncbi:MAG: metalloregulator ArsR/SmtB family transcription factor [Actinomycetota bacterium]